MKKFSQKLRRWLLVSCLICAFILLLIYHGLNILEADKVAQNVLLKKLEPILNAALKVGQVDMEFGSISVKTMEIDMNQMPYSIQIEELSISYSLFSFFKSGFKPQKAPKEITLIRPRLIIDKAKLKIQQNQSAQKADLQQIIQDIQERTDIQVVYVSDAIVELIEQEGDTSIVLASGINGSIISLDKSKIVYELTGKVLSGEETNLDMQGELFCENGEFNVQLNLNNYDIARKLPFNLPDSLSIQEGILHTNLNFEGNISQLKDVNYSGKFQLEQGQINLISLSFQALDIEGEIVNQDVSIQKATGKIDEVHFSMEGNINNLSDPDFDLKVSTRVVNASLLQHYFGSNLPVELEGKIQAICYLTGNYSHPLVKVKISSPRIIVENVKLNRESNLTLDTLSTVITYSDSAIIISQLKAYMFDSWLQAEGNINLADTLIPLNINYSLLGDFPGALTPIENLKSWRGRIEGNIQGYFRLPEIYGQLGFERKSDGFIVLGDYYYEDGKIIFDTDEEFPFQIVGKISWKDGLLYQLGGSNVQELINQLNPTGLTTVLNKKTKINFQTAGSIDKMVTDAECFIIKNQNAPIDALRFKFLAEKKGTDAYIIDGDMQYLKETEKIWDGSFELIKKGVVFQFRKFEIPGQLNATATINSSGTKSIVAEISIQDMRLETLFYSLFNMKRERIQGRISNSQINVQGTIDSPIVNGNIRFTETVFHGIEGYWGNINFSSEESVFRIDEFKLKKSGTEIVTGGGAYDYQTQINDFTFRSAPIDANLIITSLFGSKADSVASGETNFTLTVNGKSSDFQPRAFIHAKDGAILHTEFDELDMEFALTEQNVLYEGRQQLRPRLLVKHASMVKENTYRVEASGMHPFNLQEDMDLHGTAEGNIADVLPQWEDFFIEASGQGKLNLHLAGSIVDPVYGSGDLIIKEGKLKLKEVIKEINDIEIKATLKDRFLAVEGTGKIDKKLFRIYNQRANEIVSARPLEPWILTERGLNSGVLVIETDEKGIRLNVPGLMEPDETAIARTAGRENGEKVYFAGPIERPIFRGKIYIEEARVTYPLLGPPADENDKVAQFLESIELDAEFVPARKNEYFCEWPNYIDKIFTDLVVEDNSEGIIIQGAIGDEFLPISGKLETHRGTIEYLGESFKIIEGGAEFDLQEEYPIVYGHGETRIPDRTSTGSEIYKKIYITLFIRDPETGEDLHRGNWEFIQFKLSSDNTLDTQEDILQQMGYSAIELKPGEIRNKGLQVGGVWADNFVFRPLVRPVEKQLEKMLGLDVVRIKSNIASNLFEGFAAADSLLSTPQEGQDEFSTIINQPLLLFLRGTRITLGKYISDSFYLNYTGRLVVTPALKNDLGIRHVFALDYNINPNLHIATELDYDVLNTYRGSDLRSDKRLQIYYSFALKGWQKKLKPKKLKNDLKLSLR